MEEVSKPDLLRSLPQIDELLTYLDMQDLGQGYPRPLIVVCARKAVADTRNDILSDKLPVVCLEAIARRTLMLLEGFYQPSLRKAINVSGIIIHTNLGRSVLADEAQQAVQEAAGGYSTLEYNTATRARGSRHSHCEALLCYLTGAEAALAVNNNAAAVLMVLSEFAQNREVIVSRGELVEIGGSFRIPDIMRLSHAHMIEVGTTNKTHQADYQNAIGPATSLLLKVHQSNFKVLGFTEEVGVSDLRTLADQELAERSRTGTMSAHDPAAPDELLVYEDQGSGILVDLGFLTAGESMVSESLQAGSDLVSFSGDKLLGGPQAGIIVGKKKYVDRLKRSPFARALRLDKLSLAALEATLRLYLDKEKALEAIPTLRMLTMPSEEVRLQAVRLCMLLEEALESLTPAGLSAPGSSPASTPSPPSAPAPSSTPDPSLTRISVVEEKAQAGGGSLPTSEILSYAVCIEFLQGSALECESFLVSEWEIPIVCRIKKDCLLCDPRTLVAPEDMEEIASAIKAYFARVVLATVTGAQ